MRNLVTKIFICLFVFTTGLLMSNVFARQTARDPINNEITAPEVFFIGRDGENFGVVKLAEALRLRRK